MRNQKPLPSLKIRHLEYQLQVAQNVQKCGEAQSAIRMRLQSGETSSVVPIVEHTPNHFVRPTKGYSLPNLLHWKRWLLSRVGVFLLNNVGHVLCISCGFPIPSNGGRQVLGVRGKKIRIEASGYKVTVGAVVKWTEHEDIIHGVRNPVAPYVVETSGEFIETTENKVVRVVGHTALGCTACQSHYLRLKAESDTAYRVEDAHYTNKTRELQVAWAEYRKSTPNPDPVLVEGMKYLNQAPERKAPFILVDAKEISPELTVGYWRTQQRGEV